MTAKNDVTGDSLVSKANTKEFDAGYDLIFGKSKIGSFADLLPVGNGKVKDEFTFYADVSFSNALIKPGDIVTFGTKDNPLCQQCGKAECDCDK
jgi:hypothetical protein